MLLILGQLTSHLYQQSNHIFSRLNTSIRRSRRLSWNFTYYTFVYYYKRTNMLLLSISEWFSSLSTPLQAFWTIGIISTSLFIIQVILALIGFDAEGETEIDLDGVDASFSLISFRSILAFLVCFGWIGVYNLSNGGSLTSALIYGGLAGLGAMVIVAYLLYKLLGMDESGTVDLNDLINTTGETYIKIPSSGLGKGKVTIVLAGKLMEFDAVTPGGPIATGTKIKVNAIIDSDILSVEKITKS